MTDTNRVVYKNIIAGVCWHVEAGTMHQNVFGGLPTYHLYRNWDMVKLPSQFLEAMSVDDAVITSVSDLYFRLEAHFKQYNTVGQLIEIEKAKDTLQVLERNLNAGSFWSEPRYADLFCPGFDFEAGMKAAVDRAPKHLAELEQEYANSRRRFCGAV